MRAPTVVIAIATLTVALAGCGSGSPSGTATVTVTAGATTSSATSNALAEATSAPPSYAPPPVQTVTPSKDDFSIMVKTTSKQCFGSAGCNVDVKVGLGWNGEADAVLDDSYDVTFRLDGDESGPILGTLTVNKHLRYSVDEESLSTTSTSTDVEATIVRIGSSSGF